MRAHGYIDPEAEWEKLLKREVRLALTDDDAYPPILRETARAPLGLYIKGTPNWDRPMIAIVGTRRATGEGLKTAHAFAKDLAAQGIIIISGLALGIDGAAHAGALASGAKGATIAVLPASLDDLYPKTHMNLANEIIRTGGSLISEYPFGTPSFPTNFLERNRIVAGLSRGTVVIEAPLKSGALVTARLAVEANREVFAIPGPISHPNYAGSHKLIQEGAGLVTNAEDICDALGILYQKAGRSDDAKNLLRTPEERAILTTLRTAGKPLTIDTIAELSMLSVQDASRAIAMLSVNGTLNEINGAYSL